MNNKDVLQLAKDKKVERVKLWFTDVLGFLKSFEIPFSDLELTLNEGQGFDGSSIQGFTRIEESDMVAKPDPDTFRMLPWIKRPTAAIFCDVLNPEGSFYEGDPRYILKRMLAKAKKAGFDHFYVGPEAEYFYFKDTDIPSAPAVIDKGGYFDTIDGGDTARAETVFMLEEMGIKVEYHHHEVGPSQHEIDLMYCDALAMADNMMTYRYVVKEIARLYGLHASFMPKPIFGQNGSGMHTHQSLFKGDRNAFFDPSDKNYHLSDVGFQYVAGLLKYVTEVTLVLNPLVNSYKRLVLGYEAPVYLTWAVRNRSDLIRIPVYKPGKENATRLELRSPDPSCNPYLAFTVMLACGLKGIKEKLVPSEQTKESAYGMTEQERKKRNIKCLPTSLGEAIEKAEKSRLLKEALGAHVFEKLIENKKHEWSDYIVQIHQWELEKYLPIY